MPTISLPDSLLAEAERKAAAQGISLQSFVAEAVELHLEDAPEAPAKTVLTRDQIAIVRQGQAEIRKGKFLTSEELKAELAQNRRRYEA